MPADEVLTHVLPQFFPAAWLEEAPGILFCDFPSRIRIGYVLRKEGHYEFIFGQEFAALKVHFEDLHGAALANLKRLHSASVTAANIPAGAEAFISAVDDNFAAVRILLPDVQRKLCEALGPEFFVSLPHRDDCFCWSTTQPAERQTMHCRNVLQDFLEDDYKLTPDILLYSRGTITLDRAQST